MPAPRTVRIAAEEVCTRHPHDPEDKAKRPWTAATNVYRGESRFSDPLPGALVYGTTAAWQLDAPEPIVFTETEVRHPQWNGCTTKTHFIASMLLPTHGDDVIELLGRHTNAKFSVLQRKIRYALGIGTSAGLSATNPNSLRGVVVRFTDAGTKQIGSRYGLVVTCHDYSSLQRFQTVIPVSAYRPQFLDIMSCVHLQEAEHPWIRAIWPSESSAVVNIPYTIGINQQHIDMSANSVKLNDITLGQVDTALSRHFSLWAVR